MAATRPAGDAVVGRRGPVQTVRAGGVFAAAGGLLIGRGRAPPGGRGGPAPPSYRPRRPSGPRGVGTVSDGRFRHPGPVPDDTPARPAGATGLELPPHLRRARYAAGRFPGAPGPENVAEGANCQRYAYAVLRWFGFAVPPLRSAELWEDTEATLRVAAPRPLDLVLFDHGEAPRRPEGYGAHVGVHLGPGQVLHLCAEVGQPAVWSYRDFAERPRYARFLGAKRPLRRVDAS
jgi:hypothetical protein